MGQGFFAPRPQRERAGRQSVPVILAILAAIPGLIVGFGPNVAAGPALALLALIATLPEYVVDASVALLATDDPGHAGYAAANMSGANRLLIGLAGPLVVLVAWLRG